MVGQTPAMKLLLLGLSSARIQRRRLPMPDYLRSPRSSKISLDRLLWAHVGRRSYLPTSMLPDLCKPQAPSSRIGEMHHWTPGPPGRATLLLMGHETTLPTARPVQQHNRPSRPTCPTTNQLPSRPHLTALHPLARRPQLHPPACSRNCDPISMAPRR